MKMLTLVVAALLLGACGGPLHTDKTCDEACHAPPMVAWAQLTASGGGSTRIVINGSHHIGNAELGRTGTDLVVFLDPPIVGACASLVVPSRPEVTCMAQCRGTSIAISCLNIGGSVLPFPGHNFRDASATTLSLSVFH